MNLIPALRDARDDDSTALAALVASCFSEYPDCLFEWSEFPELRRPASHFAAKGGRLWVATDESGRIVGSVGVAPVPEQNATELTKVYVAPVYRGTGLAQAMFERVLGFAREHGHGELILWSDARFTRGHRFYEKLGFCRWPGERYLADISASWEFHFRKPLAVTQA